MMDRDDKRTERDQQTMTEPRPDEGLSTADLAGGQHGSVHEGEPPPAERPAAAAPAAPVERPAPAAPQPSAPGPRPADESRATPLFASGDAESYRGRWGELQTRFVDDPRSAVEEADHLVAEVMKRLAVVFADERTKLEQQWARGDNVDTEALRLALRRYRSFFDRLLAV